MKLYLVQHGDTLPKETDPERPLSDKGRADVARMAAFLAPAVRVAHVLHSGRTRARDTAALLAAALGPGGAIEEMAGVGPTDPTDALADAATGWSEDVMVVGHLPFMGRLVSRLVAGSEDAGVVAFAPGSVVCLERADGAWTVAWMVRPALLGETS